MRLLVWLETIDRESFFEVEFQAEEVVFDWTGEDKIKINLQDSINHFRKNGVYDHEAKTWYPFSRVKEIQLKEDKPDR